MDKNRRRILPTIPRPSTAETRPSAAGTSVAPAYPPPCTPVTPNPHPSAPEVRSASMGPWGGRLEPGKPPEATPASGFMLALRTSRRDGQMRVPGHRSAHVGEPGCRVSGGTCGKAVHGRGIVGRRCFSTSSSLNRTSSIWRLTNLVDLGHASSSRRDRPRPQSMPALSPAR